MVVVHGPTARSGGQHLCGESLAAGPGRDAVDRNPISIRRRDPRTLLKSYGCTTS